MEKKFFEFVNDIILYLSLDEDIKLIEKKDIYEKVVYFSRTLSTDVETLIDGEMTGSFMHIFKDNLIVQYYLWRVKTNSTKILERSFHFKSKLVQL